MKGVVWKLLYERKRPNSTNSVTQNSIPQSGQKREKSSTEGRNLDTIPRKYTHKSSFLMADKTDICLFCETMSSSELLREVSTFHLNSSEMYTCSARSTTVCKT